MKPPIFFLLGVLLAKAMVVFSFLPGRDSSMLIMYVVETDKERIKTRLFDKELNGDGENASPMLISEQSKKGERSSESSETKKMMDKNDNNDLSYSFQNDMSRVDIERMKSRFSHDRSYARREPFKKENLKKQPTMEDFLPPSIPWQESLYLTFPARFLVFGISAGVFPMLVDNISMITSNNDAFSDLVSKFVPGISILYGTMITLTLDKLYSRQEVLQDSIARESSILSMITKNFLTLPSEGYGDLILHGGRCIADQVKILVGQSRGQELMTMIASDPYESMVDLLDDAEVRGIEYSDSQNGDLTQGQLLSNCRNLLNQLVEIRATRLSHEANSLTVTHFQLINILTVLLLVGYTFSFSEGGVASSVLFGILTTTYLQFYNFANDLNEPFGGVYQIRRAASAVHLLKIKNKLMSHPSLCDLIDFENDDAESVI